jgi:uncharacterized membrane protein
LSETAPRLPLVDAARGGALVAMAVYHVVWDLGFFGFVDPGRLQEAWFKGFGHAIAAAFLTIVGASLALAARGGLDLPAYFRRMALVFAAAMAVTAATAFVFPDSFVAFGVLHCIVAASLFGFFLLDRPWPLIAGAGALVLALPLVVQAPALDATNWWSGLGAAEPHSHDWRPFFPWAGFTLIGLAGAKWALARGLPAPLVAWRAQGGIARLLTTGGRHALAFYLLHQPILFALVFAAAQMAGAGPAPAPQPMFESACATQCVRSGGERAFCETACACVVREAQGAGLWDKVAGGRMTEDDRARYDALTRQCLRAAPPPTRAPSP